MASYGEIQITTKEDETVNRQIRRRAEAGELRQVMERVYTSNLHDDLAAAAAIQVPTVDEAIVAWAKVNAFMKPNSNARLEKYDPATEIDWRGEIPAPVSYWQAEENPQSILSPGSLSR